jgi:hypothetical protein
MVLVAAMMMAKKSLGMPFLLGGPEGSGGVILLSPKKELTLNLKNISASSLWGSG